ncbi:MAG: sulfatase-like hydrolase/transferase [Bacteroidetes bacterium]|nr:sulfatase-like hydrolase/transferase [Bacteroidota bacterium]
MIRRINLFLDFIFRIFLTFGIGFVLFFIYRWLYYHHVINEQDGIIPSGMFSRAFLTGLRFDSVVIAYGLVLPLTFALTGIFIRNENYFPKIYRFASVFIGILFSLFVFILVIDYYYYEYFQAHINILIFGFFQDDTGAVMQSVWSDYPLVRVLLGLLGTILLFRFIFKKLFHLPKKTANYSLPLALVISIFSLGLFFSAMRASFGTFPVQIDDANISDNAKVNLIPVNGVFALKEALSVASIQNKLKEFDSEIKAIRYTDPVKSVTDYFGAEITDDSGFEESFFSVTDSNTFAKENPPNVIFFLMESMSNNNLFLHSPQLNVLGALEPHFHNDILFRKFLPCQNGTINSLEGIMVNSPITSLAQSKYCTIQYPSSVAIPFKENGYSTTFITGGKLNWRNINTFIPYQGFDVVEGDANIKTAIPSTQECEWGVYDEFLFEHVFNKLKQAAGKPQMIFSLTTTNHTPFHLPESYKPYPVVLSDSIKKILKVDETMARKNLTNLQYSNDCLGKFLDQLKASPFGKNTIVVATGDHNNLMLFDFRESMAYYKLSVPMLMYVPKDYLHNSRVDTTRWGSHKDIFPTLFNLALSNTRYFNGGTNLLQKTNNRSAFFAVDLMSYIAIDDYGAVRFDSKPQYYSWSTPYQFSKLQRPDFRQTLLMKKARSYFSSFYHYIRKESESEKKK